MRLSLLLTYITRQASVALRRRLRVSLAHAVIFAGISAAQTAPVTLRVAAGSAPAGSSAQIQVYADSPVLISKGIFAMDLDPQFFGPIQSVSAISATGDALMLARINGTHLEAQISSLTGGLGQLPGVPLFTVRAPILTNAAIEGSVALSLPAIDPFTPAPIQPYPTGAWQSPGVSSLAVQLVSNTFARQGTLSVRDVLPNSGIQPAGTILRITGTGFTPATKVTADGMAFSKVEVVSSTELRATLASAREITALGLMVVNGQDSVKVFPAPPSRFAPLDPGDTFDNGLHASLPIRTQISLGFSAISGAYGAVLSNPSPAEVTITVGGSNPLGAVPPRTFTLPAFETRFFRQLSLLTTVSIASSAPIRMARYEATVRGSALISDLVERTQPIIASVTSAASQRATQLSPGEIITIRGLGLGELTGLNTNSDGKVSTSGPPFGNRVLIGNIPAPILYGSPTQWNVVVPYELDGAVSADVQIVLGNENLSPTREPSLRWTLPMAPTAPALFTSLGTGIGQAAVLNQDNTLNSPDNPGPRGSVIQLFATGVGQVSPNAQTGSVATAQGGTQYPVSVRFNGTDFTPTYAGPAPGLVAGVVQVNAVIPTLAPGSTARVSLVVNGVESPNGITVAVKQ